MGQCLNPSCVLSFIIDLESAVCSSLNAALNQQQCTGDMLGALNRLSAVLAMCVTRHV